MAAAILTGLLLAAGGSMALYMLPPPSPPSLPDVPPVQSGNTPSPVPLANESTVIVSHPVTMAPVPHPIATAPKPKPQAIQPPAPPAVPTVAKTPMREKKQEPAVKPPVHKAPPQREPPPKQPVPPVQSSVPVSAPKPPETITPRKTGMIPLPPLPEERRNWRKAPRGWYNNFDEAADEARKENKPILLLLTGSDWCHYCMKLREETLTSGDFKRLSKKFEKVYLDFPRRELPEAQAFYNQQLRKRLARGSRSYPTTLLVTQDGKLLGKIHGYQPKKSYIQQLKNLLSPTQDSLPR